MDYYIVLTEMEDGSEGEFDRTGDKDYAIRAAGVAYRNLQYGPNKAVRGIVRILGGEDIYSYPHDENLPSSAVLDDQGLYP